MKNKGAIAILGGMGPEASAKMLEVMVSMAAREFGAKDCRDFPEIIVNSIPVPDFISDRKNVNLAKTMLIERIGKLETMNISCFAIACNTAHIMAELLMQMTDVPFISMIDAVAENVSKSEIKTVGLLATPSTINSLLYQNSLQKFGVRVVVPSNRQIVSMEKVIRKVIAGTNNISDSKRLLGIAQSLTTKGAQGIILGCTELPLAFPKEFELPVFDSIEVLSRKLLAQFFEMG